MEQSLSSEETLAALAAGSAVMGQNASPGMIAGDGLSAEASTAVGREAMADAAVADAVAVGPAAVDGVAAEPVNYKKLESTAMNATFWTVMDYGSSTSLRIVNSLVMTRLLLPEAFGEVGLVMTLIVGVSLLSDLGLAPSVIQNRRGDEPAFLNTVWTIQAMRGAALWVIAMMLAYPASLFYHDPHLLRVLPVLALITVLNGLNSTGLITLSRHMGVKRLFLLDFSTQIVSTAITIGVALRLHSVWALVLGNVGSNVYRLVLSHTGFVSQRRNHFHIDRSAVREIVRFGKWIFLGTAAFFFASQADRLVLGRLVSLTTLGVYAIAFQISDVPRAVISAFSNNIGLPFASKLNHLPMADFRVRFLRYRRFVLLAGAFLLSTMAVWGGWAVTKVYPVRFHDASWMIPILACGLWHTLLYNTTAPALLSRGVSTYNAGGNALYAGTMLLGIPLAFHQFGLVGAIVAIAAGDLPLYAMTQTGAVRHGVKPLVQDAGMTCVFLGMLALQYGLRRMI